MNRFAVKKNLECGRKWLAKRGFSTKKMSPDEERIHWISPGGAFIVGEPTEEAMLRGIHLDNCWMATKINTGEVGLGDSPSDAITDWAMSEDRAESRRKSLEVYDRCHEYAARKHAGQLRKDGTPYIAHPEAVAEQFNYGDKAKTVAILHDVLEDTDATEEEIWLLGCDDEIVNAVKALTHDKNALTYMEYIKSISGNPIARMVKLADLRHNLSTIDSIEDESCREFLRKRYQKAMAFLEKV